MKSPKMSSNIEIDPEGKCITISVNPRIFSMDVVFSAAYVFLDRAYILVDGDPKTRITVEMKPRGKTDLEKLGREFNNELLNYSVYKNQVEKNSAIRQSIIQRALLTNYPEILDSEEESCMDDPEGIAVPWEEKFGDKKKQ